MTELAGWSSAMILALTISSQVYAQWRSKSCAGVSNWFFIGQMLASLGFVLYSYLVENWVFVWTNAFNFVAALIGQSIHAHNRRMSREVIAAAGQTG
ncbi:hypothetical protein [Noviherbaspirillum sedimenti]|uniref:PQ-loop repeat-containing protein n=1 Tax=Noviherbaspirillum sedimenti TaxID=2320865 RepID=A0A3A3GA48_9BURK|nr:hypothetical protein [Noviherbaspirillum sedimenti]RJG01586.1 hypothetical protein D3878_08300 [Noviherbaspirillum sedimenti]RJG08197.1 hypothetical protein D3878_00065 [Noviherbaspirillum sedimenti]